MRRFILSVLLVGMFGHASANQSVSKTDSLVVQQLVELEAVEIVLVDSIPTKPTVKFKRGKAIIFTVLTGLLGGHRIYLGTHHRTPIIYSITLGGLGILPFVDLINLIFTKDISKFEDKSQIIMWGD